MTMNDFVRYQAGADDHAEHQATSLGNMTPGRTYTASTIDGVETLGVRDFQACTAAEVNPYHGDGTILSTAVNPNGRPVLSITDETLLTHEGLQAPASFWAAQGFIHRTASGTYAPGAGSDAAPRSAEQTASVQAAEQSDVIPIHPDHESVRDAALEGLSGADADALAAAAIGTATGRLDPAAAVGRFAKMAGVSTGEAAGRLEALQAVYQAQADGVLMHKFGIDAGDLQGFYGWARVNRPGQLGDAIGRQVHGSDLSGYRQLAKDYRDHNAPSDQALRQAGVGGRPGMVWIAGMGWTSAKAAARAGLV